MCHCKTLCKMALFVNVQGLGKRNNLDAKVESRNADIYVLFPDFLSYILSFSWPYLFRFFKIFQL